MQPVKGRLHAAANNPVSQPHHGPSVPPESWSFEDTLNQTALRDPMPSRGRLPGNTNVVNPVSLPAAQVMPPRSQSSAATARSPTGPSGGMERRPSVTQTFHYTNKSHGGYSHVRNASFVNSPATSPLSPHVTPADHAIMTMSHHATPDLRPKEPPLSLTNGSITLTSGSSPDRENGDGSFPGMTPKRVDRTNSSKPRRAHRTHMGEYALCHLFTSVWLHGPPPDSTDKKASLWTRLMPRSTIVLKTLGTVTLELRIYVVQEQILNSIN